MEGLRTGTIAPPVFGQNMHFGNSANPFVQGLQNHSVSGISLTP
jgi:hypothetical protein